MDEMEGPSLCVNYEQHWWLKPMEENIVLQEYFIKFTIQ